MWMSKNKNVEITALFAPSPVARVSIASIHYILAYSPEKPFTTFILNRSNAK